MKNTNKSTVTFIKGDKTYTRPMRKSDYPIEMAEAQAANIYDKFTDCVAYAAAIQEWFPDYQPPWTGIDPNHQIPWTAEGKKLFARWARERK
jgi:hypothetical protein